MRQQPLSESDVKLLRERNLLQEGEVAFKEGHAYIAENIITKTRRILNIIGLILEADRKILHD